MEKKNIIISPSLLSSDFAHLAEGVMVIERSGADWVHLDVMDGHFVPPITFGEKVVKDIRKNTKLPLDVHLMIEKPENKIKDFVDAGADWITIHSEATVHLHRVLSAIQDYGVKAGVSIVPSTSVSSIKPVLSTVDLVLVMSVNPGYGGQKFIPSSIDKIKELAKYRFSSNLKYLISVDGGVNQENATKLKEAGADVLISGSSFFNSEDTAKAVVQFKS